MAPAVMVTEVGNHITSLGSGKSPGEDLVLTDLIKTFPNWWSLILAKLLFLLNNTAVSPIGWKTSILVPVHKRENKITSNNCYSISFLDTALKLYDKCHHQKPEDWVKNNNSHQAGFRRDQIDHGQSSTIQIGMAQPKPCMWCLLIWPQPLIP